MPTGSAIPGAGQEKEAEASHSGWGLPAWGHVRRLRQLRPLLFLVILLFLTGCRDEGPTGTPAAAPTPLPMADEPTPAAPQPDMGATAGGRVPVELRFWLPDFMGRTTADQGGLFLDTAVSRFEQAHPGVRVVFSVKSETGRAALATYLRSVQQAAPAMLPDLILVNSQDLWRLAAEGILQPLPLAQPDSFYPFAVEAVTFQDSVYGIPYSVDLTHIAYHGDRAESPPLTWQQQWEDSWRLIFPGAARDGRANELLLLYYLSAGGSLSPEGALDNPVALENVYTFLADGAAQGGIPGQIQTLAAAESVWSLFLDTPAGLAVTHAGFYLSRQELDEGIRYGPVPTPDGSSHTVAQVWAMSLVTPNPQRQELARELIGELLDPAVHAGWNRFAYRLPSRPAALAQWEGDATYRDFVALQAEQAVSMPNGPIFADGYTEALRLQRAVLAGEIEPRDAVLDLFAAP